METPDELYLNAWQDLAKKIREGSSFSGRERNCSFLNLGNKQFADVSSAVGLDLIDDSRSVAKTDWDQDGDLDLILANRTGPRLRFLKNRLPNSSSSISITLVGDVTKKVNRDAIGAKVQANILDASGKQRQIVRTLSAGDGFLSQSSKSIHVGLQTDESMTRLRVRWPGDTSFQEIANVPKKGRCIIHQSTGSATSLPSRMQVQIEETPFSPHSIENETSVSLSVPVDPGPLDYWTLQNEQKVIDFAASKATWIVLWATWCRPCLEELLQIASANRSLREEGINVVALSVENLEEDSKVSDTIELVNAWQQQNRFPFELGLATSGGVQRLDRVRRDVLYGNQQLPIPASFLVDQQGKVRAFFLGQVTVKQITSEAKELGADDAARRTRSVPFPGRWATDRFVTNPIAIANIYREELQFDDAREYLKDYLEKESPPSHDDQSKRAENSRRRLADVYQLWGQIALDQNKYQEAALVYEKSVSFFPSQSALIGLGRALNQQGKSKQAVQALKRANAIRPHAETYNRLGVIFQNQAEYLAAKQAFQNSLRTNPRFLPAANNLAWLMATCPQPQVRDGKQAVLIAEKLAQSTKHQRPDILDTLAAAYAENGDFSSAIDTAERAMAVANQHKLTPLAERISARLQLFRRNEPFRIPATP